MRFAMIMTIGVLVGSAQIPCEYEVTAIIQAPACLPFGPRTAFGQFLDLRVDGDNGSPTGDGSGWGLDAYKYLQDALADAADAPPGATVRLLVAATDPGNPYRPDRDAANPIGTGDRVSTFLLNFSNVQLLGGFPPGGGDLADRDPALYETVLSGVLQLQCGVPNAGNCFQPNGTPGCDNAGCCEAVCTVDPDCCEVAWNQACADLASTVCGSCGDQGSGDCFVANGTPGCDDVVCCRMVCGIDPSCCFTAWDQGCADLATQTCDLCGEPGFGDCFENNGTPWCVDMCGGQDCPGCCELVCAARPECCNDQWDQACANFAKIVCGVCGEPGSGSCFEPNGTPGCEDGNCCALVCDEDPICCILPWDEICADIAGNVCSPPTAVDPPKAYHVVTADGVDDSVRIDGFTITNGLANGVGSNTFGAGISILNASPAVVRVTFTENSAPAHGGGAMHIGGTSHPLVVNCSMTTNDGGTGGAIHISPAPASATLVNCLISGNTATISGGGIIARSSFPATLDLINCTVTDNTAPSSGGGIWVAGTMEVTITNSILWRNVPDQINGVATVTYSDVEGGWGVPMDMNIDDDPLFVDPDNGDYRLSPGSPCLDAADNTAVPKGVVTDLDGNARYIEDPNTLDTGLGDCPIVDMGSYEFQEGATDCCPGDLDASGDVGVKDLLILLGAWGPCPPKGDCPADFDGSGDVGVKDLLFLLGNWGPCP